MYDPLTDPKSDAEKHSLFKVSRMLQHLQKNSEIYWDPEWYLSIGEQTIGFQDRHNYKLQIMFKYAVDIFQYDAVFDRGCTYSFIYRKDDIPKSKQYLCATSERFI